MFYASINLTSKCPLLIPCSFFRIVLERMTSASVVPQAQIEKEVGGNVEMQEIKMRQNYAGQKDVETYTFSWQEKVFSKVRWLRRT